MTRWLAAAAMARCTGSEHRPAIAIVVTTTLHRVKMSWTSSGVEGRLRSIPTTGGTARESPARWRGGHYAPHAFHASASTTTPIASAAGAGTGGLKRFDDNSAYLIA